MTELPAIEARGLSAAYHRQTVLSDISLTLPAGQWTAIVGPNGAGKSSLLKVVTGSLRPLRGELRVLGGNAREQRRAGKIAYMPQHEQMEWDFPVSVRETVMTGRYGLMRRDPWWQRVVPQRWANPLHRDAVDEALDAVDMYQHATSPIGELSGGQKKRVMLARALAQRADILLLDEPLAGVDSPSERLILSMLEREQRAGRTIVMVTHDLPSARHYADQVALINHVLVGIGPPSEMLSDAMLAQLAIGGSPAGGLRVAA
ncbi:ABC transporter [Halomonas sp. 1513]|nr:metal ABC transporter ATP-binding protein [Halomonas sp. 1513]APX94704.1 ABC transporter [Halomonas sp. 1513]